MAGLVIVALLTKTNVLKIMVVVVEAMDLQQRHALIKLVPGIVGVERAGQGCRLWQNQMFVLM